MRAMWFSMGWVFFGAGVAGLFLPLVPGAPMLIFSAFCFSRSSPKWHAWLLERPHIGPMIKDWDQRRAISRHSKKSATVLMVPLFSLTVILTSVHVAIKVVIVLIGVSVLTFIWTRPD